MKSFFKALLGVNGKNIRSLTTPKPRKSAIEPLENRELLSASPLEFDVGVNVCGYITGDFTIEEAIAAYEESRAPSAINLDDIEFTDFEPDVMAAPGAPSVYFDADKSWDDGDNLQCWAATAANMLWHTGWGRLNGLNHEQDLFDKVFTVSFANSGGMISRGCTWFLADETPPTRYYLDGGYYSNYFATTNVDDFVSSVFPTSTSSQAIESLSTLAERFAQNDGVGLSIVGGNGHAVTCWGYNVDSSYSSSDPRYYSGLWITDSDDERGTNGVLNERKLVYISLEWSASDNHYLFYNNAGYDRDDGWYLREISFISQRPNGAVANKSVPSVGELETPSLVVTSLTDKVNGYDGEITLREAIAYASDGDTVRFDSSLNGGTITLDGSELRIGNKSISIAAETPNGSNLNICVDGAGRSGVFYIYGNNDDKPSVALQGLSVVNGQRNNGGGIYAYGVDLTVSNCSISNCVANNSGGAVYIDDDASASFYQCLITDNAASSYGGAFETFGIVDLYSCTVAGNSAKYGGGFDVDNSKSRLSLYNSIVATNVVTSSDASSDIKKYNSNASINAYNTLSTYAAWDESVSCYSYASDQPLFTNAASGDYTLADGSQAINKGNNNYVSTAKDLAGQTRVNNGTIDLGAYEYQTSNSTQLPAPSVAYDATPDSITLSWSRVTNASGYQIVFNGTSYALAASVTSYTFEGLSSNTEYTFVVRAQGNGATYLDSPDATVSVTTLPENVSYPTQLDRPTLAELSKTSTSLTVGWGSIPNAKSYNLYYAVKSSSPTYTKAASLGASKTSWTIPNLQANTNYYVKIQAIGDGVYYTNSAYSPTITVKTKADDVEDPSTIVTTLGDVVNANDGLISLREAINYAADGDTILFDASLDGGTITLNGTQLEIWDKGLSILAESPQGDMINITIDANEQSRVFYINSHEWNERSITFEGLQIVNGKATNSSSSNGYGGGVYARSCELTMTNCLVDGCQASSEGGGIFIFGELAATYVSVENCRAGSNGGGIYANYTGSNIEKCYVANCSAEQDGGGIYLNATNQTSSLSTTTIVNCSSGNNGGGVYADCWFETTLTNLYVDNCSAQNNGGGFYADCTVLTMEGSSFEDCSATNNGGGIYFAPLLVNSSLTPRLAAEYVNVSGCIANDGGGIYFNSLPTETYGVAYDAQFSRVNLDGNIATHYGGGIYAVGDTIPKFVYANVLRNSAGLGGGFYVNEDATVDIEQSLIAENAAGYGGGIESYGVCIIDKSTITANTANAGGGGIDVDGHGLVVLSNSIVAENAASYQIDVFKRQSTEVWGYNTLASFNSFDDQSWDVNQSCYAYDVNQPLFADAANGDYSLAPNSQAIDKGSLGETPFPFQTYDVDLADRKRIDNGELDLGAYEYQTEDAWVVTTLDDVVNPYDGLISLREAISYASDGDRILFDASLDGGTITLGGERLEIYAKSLEIIAESPEWNALDITIDANEGSGVFLIENSEFAYLEGFRFLNADRRDDDDWWVYGAGIDSNNSHLRLTNCSFENCDGSYGGGIRVVESDLTLNNCSFDGCDSSDRAGAIYAISSTLTMSNVSIDNCVSGDAGSGGVFAESSDLTLISCSITNCFTWDGSGGIAGFESYVTMYDCLIENCSIDPENGSGGGGIDAGSGSIWMLTNCVINNCSAPNGGGISVEDASLTLNNCRIDNCSAEQGGGIYVGSGNVELYSCTVTANSAETGGGAFLSNWYNRYSETANISFFNSIVAENVATLSAASADIFKESSSVNTVYGTNTLSSYADWDGDESCRVYNPNLPLFADATNGDYTLAANSQAINKGDNAYASDLDLALKPRVVDGTVDLGAYEYQTTPGVWIVTTLDDVYNTANGVISLREAIGYAGDGDTILFDASLDGGTIVVTRGEYCIDDKSLTINAQSPEGRDLSIYLEANEQSSFFTIYGDRDDTVTLRRLWLFHGKSGWDGGAISVYGANLDLQIVEIIQCKSGGNGGGIYAVDSNVSVVDCHIHNCVANGSGGGVYLQGYGDDDNAYFANSDISGNVAETGNGGSFYFSGPDSYTIENSTLMRASAPNGLGGSIFVSSDSHVFINQCLMGDNHATWGGALEIFGDVTILGSTITTNSANHGGGIDVDGDASFNIYNSIVVGNASNDSPDIKRNSLNAYLYGCNTLSTYNSWNDGASCYVYDSSKPLFESGKFTLAANSQAINKGDNSYAWTSSDLAGKTRIVGGTVDLGAYEYQGKVQLARPTLTETAKTATSISVSWETVPNAKSYNLYYAVKSSSPSYVKAASLGASKTSWTISGLQPNTSYYLKIQAIGDNVNFTNSQYSPTITVKTPNESEPLLAPAITSTTATASTITVNWNAVSGASGYEIVYGNKTISNIGANATGYTISGLAANTSYSIKMKALGNGTSTLDSAYSNVVSQRTNQLVQLDRPVAAAPARSSDSIAVIWNAIPNASSYTLSYAVKATSPVYTEILLPAETTDYTIGGLASSTNYYVKVRANGDNVEYRNSAQSATITVKTTAGVTTLDAPAITATSATASTITVDWNSIANASGYEIVCGNRTFTSIDANATSYTISGLAANTSYSIKMKALGNGSTTADSEYTAVVSQRTNQLIQLDRPVVASTAKTASSITVAWDAISNASSYTLSYAVKATSPVYTEVPLGASATSYKINGLAASTNYYIKVRANGDNVEYKNSAQSATITVKTNAGITTLATPEITGTTATASTITVNWNAVSGASGYEIVYGNKTISNIGANATGYTISGLAANTSYSIKMKAVGNGTSTLDSAYSNVVSLRTNQLVQLDRPVVASTAKTASTIAVAWDAIPNASSYTLSYAVKATSPVYTEVQLSAETTDYTIGGLASSANYYVKVRANGDNVEYRNSAQSATITVKTTAGVTTLDAPAITATSATASTITVNWGAVAGAAGYEVVCGPKTSSVAASQTSAVITGLSASTNYSVQVRALGNGTTTVDSAYSAAVSQSTTALVQLDRPVLWVTDTTSNTINVSWDAVPNASSYTLSYAVKASVPTYQTISLGASKTNYLLRNLDPSTSYYIKIRANGDNVEYKNSAQSATQTARTDTAASNATLEMIALDEDEFEFDEILALHLLETAFEE